ncbi:serine O-acetyltransferase, partial [Neisseria sp. P0015.S009]
IRVNECAKIGAGSVVVAKVPAYSTVVGVPARVVGNKSQAKPAEEMNQDFYI